MYAKLTQKFSFISYKDVYPEITKHQKMTYLLHFVQKMTSHSLFCCCPAWFEQFLTELNESTAIANMYS